MISGTDNLPMPGVNIVEKGTMNGTVADLDGKYTLTVSRPDVVIVFSFLGFATQEIKIDGRTQIDVVLEEMIRNP